MTIPENLDVGGLVILLLFLMRASIKIVLARSKQVPADWSSVILPIVLVAVFVIFLLVMV